ncbi:hypothetical protein [Streptomyces sp. NPDC017524]|uniref:hypothetical protein n=1 Tax=unclassified Streptomyces TaxID=2593676 RepID=UPI00378E008A
MTADAVPVFGGKARIDPVWSMTEKPSTGAQFDGRADAEAAAQDYGVTDQSEGAEPALHALAAMQTVADGQDRTPRRTRGS